MTNEEFIKSVSLEGEIWKDVIGYEGFYKVSSLGRLSSMGRFVKFGSKFLYKDPSLISDTSNENRYNKATLKVNGKKKPVNVHRLVAEAFLPNPHNYRCIDHIDGVKANNQIDNLRWCSDLQNQNNPITRIKQRKTLIDKKSSFAPKPVVRIDENGTTTVYATACETKSFGFNQSMVTECCKGNRKHHRNYKWMYLSDYENLINKSKNA